MSPRVTREYSEFRRRQIVTAAWECFTEKGYHETTIRDVTRKLGLSTGIVYRYFKGKAAILEAVHECGRANTADFVERMTRKGTARAAIQEFISAVMMQAPAEDLRRNARGAIGLWAEALKRPAYLRIYRRQYRSVAKELSQIIAAGIKGREFRKKVDPEAFAAFLLALASGLQVQLVLNEGGNTQSYCRSINNILLSNIWE